LLYYLLLFAVDLTRNRPSLHPELLVWAPNVLFFALGAYRFLVLSRK
jgi:lipopolysaccharide export LptBFGC system permease protein LptF